MSKKGERGDDSEEHSSKAGLQEVSLLGLAKKHWALLVLLAILLFGFYLRSYHLDYPVIGYHNMKEAHTMMEARHFLNGENLLVNKYDYQSSLYNPNGIHSDNFPLFTWIITFAWKFTGESVLVARLITILFSLAGIAATYLIVKQLFGRKELALLSSLFMAIMPIYIFFGKTVFFDVPALTFSLWSLYFFVRWTKEPRMHYFTLFVVFITLGALSKMVFLAMLFPAISIFPLKRILSPEKLRKYAFHYLSALILPVVFLGWNSMSNNTYSGSVLSKINGTYIARFFSSAYWGTILNFAITDNFTTIGLIIAIIGFGITLVLVKKKEYRFVAVWFLSIFPYAFFVGWMMEGHSYYQLPFVPIISILIALTLLYISNTLVGFLSIASPVFRKPIVKQPIVFALIAVFFFLFMYSSFKLSTTRQFDTQFFGLDTAGQFISANAGPEDRVFGTGNQDTGFYWYADRPGRRLTNNLTETKLMEEKLNYRWVFLHFGLGAVQIIQDPSYKDTWNYIKDNYHLRAAGLVQVGNQVQPYYYILEKGGKFNESEFFANNRVEPKKQEYEQTTQKMTLLLLENSG